MDPKPYKMATEASLLDSEAFFQDAGLFPGRGDSVPRLRSFFPGLRGFLRVLRSVFLGLRSCPPAARDTNLVCVCVCVGLGGGQKPWPFVTTRPHTLPLCGSKEGAGLCLLPRHTGLLPGHNRLLPKHNKLLPGHTRLLLRHNRLLPRLQRLLPRHNRLCTGYRGCIEVT